MTLLARIIEQAETEGSVPVLLRMMRTLAYRAGADDLREWTEHELNGYAFRSHLPDYRGPFSLPVYADFYNEFGGTFPNVPIDRLRFPEEWRSGPWFDHSFCESVWPATFGGCGRSISWRVASLRTVSRTSALEASVRRKGRHNSDALRAPILSYQKSMGFRRFLCSPQSSETQW